MGIEPTLPAWEAGVLPLYDTRSAVNSTMVLFSGTTLHDQVFLWLYLKDER
jgi:hypothetical protein